MIEEFVKLVPMESVLGREFKGLRAHLETRKVEFESARDKMDYDTSAYRRANLALRRFLDEWIPRCQRAVPVLEQRAVERLALLEQQSLHNRVEWSRRSEARVWQHYALDHYRKNLPSKIRRVRWYNPNLVHALFKAWRIFRLETRRWKYERIPWDGSRAMHAMIRFIVLIDDLAVSHD